MTTQFEFRLIGARAPDGELEAEHLLAIVAGLKEVATKIGRVETDAEPVGRMPKRTKRVSRLTIGLRPGSTSVLARRTASSDALEFDLADEQRFDDAFIDLVDSIGLDQRPTWVGDSLAQAAEDLAAALQQAAPEVEFKVSGQMRRRFKTQDIHRDTWRPDLTTGSDLVTFTGWLYSVNLSTHRLGVRDDVGHRVALPKVLKDTEVSRLIDSYVTVTGAPERDGRGRLTHIYDAVIVAASDPVGGSVVRAAVPLEEILAGAPGPDLDGGIELTDEEFAEFFEAVRG